MQFEGKVVEIEKALINNCLLFKNYPENFEFQQFITLQHATFLKKWPASQQLLTLLLNKNLRLNNLKTGIAINANISVFVLYFDAIIYLLLSNLNDSTSKPSVKSDFLQSDRTYLEKLKMTFLDLELKVSLLQGYKTSFTRRFSLI